SGYQRGSVALHARVVIPVRALNKTSFTEKQQKALLITTVGKIILNEILPTDFPYINEASKTNLLQGTPEEYFIFDKGANIVERVKEVPSKIAIGKEFLG